MAAGKNKKGTAFRPASFCITCGIQDVSQVIFTLGPAATAKIEDGACPNHKPPKPAPKP